MTETLVITAGTVFVADYGLQKNRLVVLTSGGMYRDAVAEKRYSRWELNNIRKAAVLTVPEVTGKQKLGDVTLYNTSTGTTFKPSSVDALDEVIENAASAIAVRHYEANLDPNWELKRKAQELLASKGAADAKGRALINELVAAGLLKI